MKSKLIETNAAACALPIGNKADMSVKRNPDGTYSARLVARNEDYMLWCHRRFQAEDMEDAMRAALKDVLSGAGCDVRRRRSLDSLAAMLRKII